MATPTHTSDTPFPQPAGVKRSFTLPASFQHSAKKPGTQAKEGETQAIETLYAHSNARIVHFTASGGGRSGQPIHGIPNQDVAGILPWKTSTERTVAAGAFRIYRVPGSVAFLNAGTSFLKPVLAKSQCWCVDGESTFVMKRGPQDYYRIELPFETDGDKAAATDFQRALEHVLLYEKTPCPFRRGFHVELPESPQITYVPWKAKHRPISPIRRQSKDGVNAGSPDGRGPHRSAASAVSRSSSRQSSPSTDRMSEWTRGSPGREYSPSPLSEKEPPASIRPTIGRFETLDKDHQREAILQRGRRRSSTRSDRISLYQQGLSPGPADYDSTPRPGLIETRNLSESVSVRLSRMNRTVTAPAALIRKQLEQAENTALSDATISTSTTDPDLQSTMVETPPIVHYSPPSRDVSRNHPFHKSAVQVGAHEEINNQHMISQCATEQSDVDATATEAADTDSAKSICPIQCSDLAVPSMHDTFHTAAKNGISAQAALSKGSATETPQTALVAPEELNIPLPESPSEELVNSSRQQFPLVEDISSGTEGDDAQAWQSATEGSGNSSADSLTSTFTGISFVTAPLAVQEIDVLAVSSPGPASKTPAETPSLQSEGLTKTLAVPVQRTQRSRSPLPMSTNLYLARQNKYEHIGAAIGEKMAGALLGPPLQLAALMLRIASHFTDGVRIRDESGQGWARRGEKGRRLPGTWDSYSEDEETAGSELEN